MVIPGVGTMNAVVAGVSRLRAGGAQVRAGSTRGVFGIMRDNERVPGAWAWSGAHSLAQVFAKPLSNWGRDTVSHHLVPGGV